LRVASRRVMLNAQVGNKNRWYEHGKNAGQRESLEIKRGGGMRKVEMARRIAEATGQEADIPARRVVRFKSGNEFKDA
jgi:hypothetical protein